MMRQELEKQKKREKKKIQEINLKLSRIVSALVQLDYRDFKIERTNEFGIVTQLPGSSPYASVKVYEKGEAHYYDANGILKTVGKTKPVSEIKADIMNLEPKAEEDCES